MTTASCSTCRRATRLRPLRQGDAIRDPRGFSARSAAATVHGNDAGTTGVDAAVPDQAEAAQENEMEVEPPAPPPRRPDARLTPFYVDILPQLPRQTPLRAPRALLDQFTDTWADALEGCMADEAGWGLLAKYRCRVLLGPVPESMDVTTELRERIELWQAGRFAETIDRVWLQQRREARAAPPVTGAEQSIDRRARMARSRAKVGARAKAMKCLVGGTHDGTAAERAAWAKYLIPRAA